MHPASGPRPLFCYTCSCDVTAPPLSSKPCTCAARRLSQTLARGITKAGVATEMVDLLSADTQELVEIVGRNSGLVILAPPSDAAEAQASLATVLSAVNPKKQKVRGWA